MESTLTKRQRRQIIKDIRNDGKKCRLTINIRYDDHCGNGHNTFAITADLYERIGDRYVLVSGGCLHDLIKKHSIEFGQYCKWHLCSSDGPTHYISNTIYHASDVEDYQYFVYAKKGPIKETLMGLFDFKETQKVIDSLKSWEVRTEQRPTYKCHKSNLEYARSTAIWPDATLEQLQDKVLLQERLPGLIEDFKAAMEELKFTY